MRIQRAYKTELDPNQVQRQLLVKAAGASRFAYNWGLRRRQEYWLLHQLPIPRHPAPTAIDLHRELNALKAEEFPWMYDVPKCAPQEALRDMERAFKNFFAGRARFPNYKSRKHGLGAFRLYARGQFKVEERHIHLPRLGRIKLKEHGYLPQERLGLHILSATISEWAGRWFVSLQVRQEIEVPVNDGLVAGVDLGISSLATVSDGTKFENPKALSRDLRKLKRQQREVSRRKKGSKNRQKSVVRLRKIHARIAHIRSGALHKATTSLAKTKSVIVVEDLNVSGMMKNEKLARAIGDVGMGEFRRQLEYKAGWYGSKVVLADMFYPSSRTCSVCGHLKEDLLLSERVYECEACGLVIDRDLNASINLERLAASPAESINACQRPEVHAETQVPAYEAGTGNGHGGLS